MKQNENQLHVQMLFDKYEMLVRKWQKAVNLVSGASLNDFQKRHISDSAQLYSHIPSSACVLVDMGSGGGFPALVLAIMNKVYNGSLSDIYLVESDTKKCVFLTEAARELGVKVHILNQRLETVNHIKADVVTSRALATVHQLIRYAQSFSDDKTVFLFLKGENVDAELNENTIPCDVQLISSQTDPKGKIVRITEVKY